MHRNKDDETTRHPLAPDQVLWEYDPWGNICTYLYFGKYIQSGPKFSTGMCASVPEDETDAEQWCAEYVRTGLEPAVPQYTFPRG